jgi:hypothetical protein
MASDQDSDARLEGALAKLDQALGEIQALGKSVPPRDGSNAVCSICMRHPEEVQFMVAGPAIFLCDICIDLLTKTLQELRDEAKAI